MRLLASTGPLMLKVMSGVHPETVLFPSLTPRMKVLTETESFTMEVGSCPTAESAAGTSNTNVEKERVVNSLIIFFMSHLLRC